VTGAYEYVNALSVSTNMGGNSRIAEKLLASQEGLFSLESDSYEELTTCQNINITCKTSFIGPPTGMVKNTHRLK
jgi:hypothetical protein